ncbi:MAG: ATP-binding cassette domain-containing protein [Pseudomonadota bacterium]
MNVHRQAGSDGGEAVVSLDEVGFNYDGRPILTRITASLVPGTFNFLTGPSGAGKTTLLQLLSLELRPTAGSLSMFGDPTAGLDRQATSRLRRRIGIVFQDFRLLDHLSVAENVVVPLRIAGLRAEERQRDLSDLLDWVGLANRGDARPPELSAGEKQRTAIARAVINAPDLILADEPTGNVDPEMAGKLMRLLTELNRQGKTVLVATHDLGLVRSVKGQVAARVLRLGQGTLSQGASDL